MKTKLFLFLCAAIPTSVIVAMNGPYQITVENLLQYKVAILQRNHNCDWCAFGESIDPNSKKELPLEINEQCELTIKIPHCVKKKIILNLNKDQKDILINQISKRDIEIVDSNRQPLTLTSYK